MSAECWCEYVDIGVGEQRVTDNPECPEHNPQQEEEPMDDGRRIDALARDVVINLKFPYMTDFGVLSAGYALVELIRAVIRDELAKAAETAKVTEPTAEPIAAVRPVNSHHLWQCEFTGLTARGQVCVTVVDGASVVHESMWTGGDGVPEHCAVCGRLKADPEPDSIFQPVKVKPLWAGACVRCGQTGRHAASCTTGRWRDVLDRASGTSVVITGSVRDMVITRLPGGADGICPECGREPTRRRKCCATCGCECSCEGGRPRGE